MGQGKLKTLPCRLELIRPWKKQKTIRPCQNPLVQAKAPMASVHLPEAMCRSYLSQMLHLQTAQRCQNHSLLVPQPHPWGRIDDLAHHRSQLPAGKMKPRVKTMPDQGAHLELLQAPRSGEDWWRRREEPFKKLWLHPLATSMSAHVSQESHSGLGGKDGPPATRRGGSQENRILQT
ncbi:UNVERIFIED_CONTAM: hypothetical protein K2H54_042849 [Gekko kuhli]